MKISILFFCSKISFGICGRFTGAELLSFSMALTIVCVWILTGHWLLMDGKKRRRFLSHGHSCLFVCLFFLFSCAIIHFNVLFFPFFSYGNGFVCGFHRFRPIAQPQSVDAIVDWSPRLRRFLGLFLVVHFQRQRYGQSGHPSGGQSRRCHGKEISFRFWNGSRCAETFSARQARLPQHA